MPSVKEGIVLNRWCRRCGGNLMVERDYRHTEVKCLLCSRTPPEFDRDKDIPAWYPVGSSSKYG